MNWYMQRNDTVEFQTVFAYAVTNGYLTIRSDSVFCGLAGAAGIPRNCPCPVPRAYRPRRASVRYHLSSSHVECMAQIKSMAVEDHVPPIPRSLIFLFHLQRPALTHFSKPFTSQSSRGCRKGSSLYDHRIRALKRSLRIRTGAPCMLLNISVCVTG